MKLLPVLFSIACAYKTNVPIPKPDNSSTGTFSKNKTITSPPALRFHDTYPFDLYVSKSNGTRCHLDIIGDPHHNLSLYYILPLVDDINPNITVLEAIKIHPSVHSASKVKLIALGLDNNQGTGDYQGKSFHDLETNRNNASYNFVTNMNDLNELQVNKTYQALIDRDQHWPGYLQSLIKEYHELGYTSPNLVFVCGTVHTNLDSTLMNRLSGLCATVHYYHPSNLNINIDYYKNNLHKHKTIHYTEKLKSQTPEEQEESLLNIKKSAEILTKSYGPNDTSYLAFYYKTLSDLSSKKVKQQFYIRKTDPQQYNKTIAENELVNSASFLIKSFEMLINSLNHNHRRTILFENLASYSNHLINCLEKLCPEKHYELFESAIKIFKKIPTYKIFFNELNISYDPQKKIAAFLRKSNYRKMPLTKYLKSFKINLMNSLKRLHPKKIHQVFKLAIDRLKRILKA